MLCVGWWRNVLRIKAVGVISVCSSGINVRRDSTLKMVGMCSCIIKVLTDGREKDTTNDGGSLHMCGCV